MAVIGYARISTSYQKFDSQILTLKKYGCTKIYHEVESGTNAHRPVLDKLIQKLSKGDVLVIYRLDRLSRGVKHLLDLMEYFHDMEIDFVSIQDNIDTSTPMGKFFFTVMGAFAEMEAALIRERICSGLAATKEKGTILGRPINEENRKKVLILYEQKYSITAIHKQTGCSRSTIYRYIRNT